MTGDILKTKASEWRVFVQEDGSSPANPYVYAGPLELGGISEDLGASTPTYAPSSAQRGQWDIVGTTRGAPALATTDFTQLADRFLTDFLWNWRKTRCRWNVVIQNGDCGRPDDLDDFDAKVIMRGVEMTAFNPLGVVNPLSGDNEADNQNTGSWSMLGYDRALKLAWGEILDSTILAEVLDATYSDHISCGECGTPSDGCQVCYFLTRANTGSPGLSSQVVVSLDGGATGISVDINTLGGVSASAMAVVGSYLVVIAELTTSHHWILLTDLEAGTTNWTQVTGGYVGSNGPRAIYSKSPAETFIAAQAGYIYKLANPTQSVTVSSDGSVSSQDLNAIDGFGQTVVAVGNSNAILLSDDAGDSWSLVTAPAAQAGVNINTVSVINKRLWWIGYANGTAYYTLDAGDHWHGVSGSNKVDTAVIAVNHIEFVDEIVGMMAVQITGGSRVYITRDNGNTWHQAPYIKALPTAERYNVLRLCDYNNAIGGGRISSGGDGIAIQASI